MQVRSVLGQSYWIRDAMEIGDGGRKPEKSVCTCATDSDTTVWRS